MISNLRKHATGIVAQIFLGVLMLSFALWGVSDVFRTVAPDSVARVGGEKITTVAFQRAYDVQKKNVSQQLGRQITDSQALMLGLPTRVIDTLASEASLDSQARDFGLGISTDVLRDQVLNDPVFAGPGGKFDAARFTQIMQASNTTESIYLVSRRQLELRQQIAAGVSAGRSLPESYRKALHELANEERAIRYFVLPAAAAGTVPEPTDEELKTYFDQTKAQWRAPEYRGLVVLKLEASDIAKPAEITDADVKATYDRLRERFVVPERREISQIIFPNRAEADAGAEKLKGGMTFQALAEELKKKPEDTRLGMLTRTAVADPKIAEAAFSLETGKASDVIDGRFGPVIIQVGEIQAGKVTAMEEVADRIRADLAVDRAASRVLVIQDQIEDERAGGSSLAEAATKAGLKPLTIPAIDRSGNGPDGAAITYPGGPAMLTAAFESDVGIETAPQPFGERGAVWFEVTKLDAARDRTLDEVKDKVVTAWKTQKTGQLLDEKAKALAERVRKGETVDAVAKDAGVTATEAPKLTRREAASGELTPQVVAAAFGGKTGTVAVADGKDGAKVVLEVEKVTLPDVAAGATNPLDARLEVGISDDLLGIFTSLVQRRLGVTVDNTAIQAAIGAPAS